MSDIRRLAIHTDFFFLLREHSSAKVRRGRWKISVEEGEQTDRKRERDEISVRKKEEGKRVRII